MALQKRLNESDIKEIMESTERFSFQYTDERKRIWFWDNIEEEQIYVLQGIPLVSVIRIIVGKTQNYYYRKGVHKTQATIREALGIKK